MKVENVFLEKYFSTLRKSGLKFKNYKNNGILGLKTTVIEILMFKIEISHWEKYLCYISIYRVNDKIILITLLSLI